MPPHDAEDLTATVLLELWRRRRSVRFVDGSLLPWLIVTATNVLRNSVRARRRYRAFLPALPPAPPAPDPAEQVTDRHASTVESVREAMADAKPVDQR